MGVKLMPLPEDPFTCASPACCRTRSACTRSRPRRSSSCPSPYESLSLLALEAFAVGTPILANARSEVLVDHCRKSNAGLYYADREEFVEALKLLVGDHQPARGDGRATARPTCGKNYRWDVIIAKYEKMFTKLRAR